jgi:hypothetical protein
MLNNINLHFRHHAATHQNATEDKPTKTLKVTYIGLDSQCNLMHWLGETSEETDKWTDRQTEEWTDGQPHTSLHVRKRPRAHQNILSWTHTILRIVVVTKATCLDRVSIAQPASSSLALSHCVHLCSPVLLVACTYKQLSSHPLSYTSRPSKTKEAFSQFAVSAVLGVANTCGSCEADHTQSKEDFLLLSTRLQLNTDGCCAANNGNALFGAFAEVERWRWASSNIHRACNGKFSPCQQRNVELQTNRC